MVFPVSIILRSVLSRVNLKIAILSRQAQLYANQRLIVAAKKRDCSITVLDPLQFPVLLHGRCNNSNELTNDGFDAIIPRFGPTWQRQGNALLMYWQSLGAVSLNNASAIALARDKLQCLNGFEQFGMPFPKSANCESIDVAENLLDSQFLFPLLIKQNNSAQGRGVEIFHDKNAAMFRIKQLFALNEAFLLQEFISEANGADIRLFIINGQLLASMKRSAAPGEFRANVHQGGLAELYQPNSEEVQLALKAVAFLGLDVAGVDIIHSSRGPLILEVNACPGFEALEQVSGVDVAGKMLDFLISKKLA
jgi:ribosomal protein S6--L-glutamate ligase